MDGKMVTIVFCCCFCSALLNVGEVVEKPAEAAVKQPPEAAVAGDCGCNKTCNCTKAASVVFSDLYSTGTHTHTPTGQQHTAAGLTLHAAMRLLS